MRIYGHAGAAGLVCENTLAGIERALADGADGVEIDVRATRDGVLVLSHDAALARVGGPEAPLVELAWADLAGVLLDGGHPVARVDAALDLAVGRGDVVLEVKNTPGEPGFDAPVERTAGLLDELLRGRETPGVCVSSFDWYAVERVTAVPTAFLSPPGMGLRAATAYAAEAGHVACHPHWTGVVEDPDAVAAAHEAGLTVVVWTVDDPQLARQLAAAGVDALITDDPAAMRAGLAGVADR